MQTRGYVISLNSNGARAVKVFPQITPFMRAQDDYRNLLS